jgi:hypothetical protein
MSLLLVTRRLGPLQLMVLARFLTTNHPGPIQLMVLARFLTTDLRRIHLHHQFECSQILSFDQNSSCTRSKPSTVFAPSSNTHHALYESSG